MLWSIVTSVIDSWALVIVQPWSAATCQRMIWLVSFRFPSSSSRRYTKVLGVRHSGRDCRNPVHREVKMWAGNYQNQTLAQRRVAFQGFWIPAIPAGMTTFLARRTCV